MSIVGSAILTAVVAVALVTDMKSRRIPNWLSLSGAAAGCAVSALADGASGCSRSFGGLAIGFAVMLALYACRVVGAGDVKLFAAVGALSGAAFVLSVAVYAIVYAGMIGVIMLLLQRQFVSRTIAAGLALIGLLAYRDVAGFRLYARSELLTFPFMLAVAPAYATAAWQRLLPSIV